MREILNQYQTTFKVKNNNLLYILIIFLMIFFFSIQEELLGSFSLFIILLLTIFFSKKYKSLASILYVSLILRLFTIILGNNFIILPDSWGDAAAFEQQAWEWSLKGFIWVLTEYPNVEKSFLISWVLAIFYSISDRSIILGQSLSLLFGMGSILLASRIAYRIWGENISIKFGWILAFYPTLILYSCLILRESYIWFFLLVAVYGAVCWLEDKRLKSLIISFFGFYFATLFHGGMFIGGLFFLIIVGIMSMIDISNKIVNLKISKKSLIILLFSVASLVYILAFEDNIPKIKSIVSLLDFDRLLIEISNRNINNAGFPDWTIPKTSFEFIYKAPIRIIYFLFSPFPWDVDKISHIIGLLDGIFYLILFILIIKNFKPIWNNKILRIIFIILLSYLLIYGLSTGNFGTGIRHRTKFIFLVILMVLPWLPKFSLKKNQYKLKH